MFCRVTPKVCFSVAGAELRLLGLVLEQLRLALNS